MTLSLASIRGREETLRYPASALTQPIKGFSPSYQHECTTLSTEGSLQTLPDALQPAAAEVHGSSRAVEKLLQGVEVHGITFLRMTLPVSLFRTKMLPV